LVRWAVILTFGGGEEQAWDIKTFLSFLVFLAGSAVAQDLGGDLTLHRLLVPEEEWKVVAEGHQFADAPCPDAAGNLYFCDMMGPATGLYKIAPDGTKTRVNRHAVSGMKFAPQKFEGKLIGCQGGAKRIVAIPSGEFPGDTAPQAEVLAEGVVPNDLVVTAKGYVYFTETGKNQVTRLDLATKQVAVVDTGLAAPNGIALSPDGGTLAVSENNGKYAWTFRIEPDGKLTAKTPWMTLRRPIAVDGDFQFNEPPPLSPSGGGDGMCTDDSGRFYVATSLGVQVFDPTGRECGLLPHPQKAKPLTSCAVAGEFLYITNGDKVYRRKVQAKSWVVK
jgi:sugar lactone lactonase YvrE